MIKFGFILFFQLLNSDSTVVELDTTKVQSSIVFKTMQAPTINTEQLRYQYRQGFFCDFEDKINQGKKIRLNLGVGEMR